jgi:dCMP deaminase
MSSVVHGPDWWTQYFLGLATYLSTASKDPSTKVGCVVVGPDRDIRVTGYNGLPRGVEDTEERLTNRELKYPRIVHAEENCVAQAARIGARLAGCTAYVNFPPCARCARTLIQAGIAGVVCPPVDSVPERWRAEMETAAEMLEEAGVWVRGVVWPPPPEPLTSERVQEIAVEVRECVREAVAETAATAKELDARAALRFSGVLAQAQEALTHVGEHRSKPLVTEGPRSHEK